MGIVTTEAEKKSTAKAPEIKITVHEDRERDSEEDESGSEDDEEYPDKVGRIWNLRNFISQPTNY